MKARHLRIKFVAVLLFYSVAVCFAGSEQVEDDPIGIVLDILKGDDQEMQAVAITMARDIAGSEMTKALVEELPNLSAAIQVQLLSALGDRGDPAALPAVIAATKAPDQSVRIAALKTLGQLGNASSVTGLAQRAAASTGDEQKAARESLYRLRGTEVDTAILAELDKAEPQTKVELISSIGERNIYAGLGALLKTAKDPDRKVRAESLKALKVIGKPVNLPALVDLLINAQSTSDRIAAEKTVAAVAHKIQDKNRQAQVVLDKLPSVKDVKSRSSLLSVLGRIGDNGALPVLRKELNSDGLAIRTAAIRSLSAWPTPEPLSDLLTLARSSAEPLHKILALRGFVRLLGLESNRSAKETLEMYKQALALAPNPMEKKGVLSGLANIKSLEAMQMAAAYLQDTSLQQEAQVAIVKIAQGICDSSSHKERVTLEKPVRDLLGKVVKISKSDSLRQQAQELIKKFEPSPGEVKQ